MQSMTSLIGFLVAVFLFNASTFTIQEHQQGIILQLGKVKGAPITQAGLHFKIPFIQDVKYFDKRILQWDGEKDEVPTKDKKFIWVDTTARWKIKDALTFYKTVRDIPNALFRMGPIIDGATKDIVSSYNLIESVRNSNNIFQDLKDQEKENLLHKGDDDDTTTLDEFNFDLVKVGMGREKLSEMIADRARERLESFGIELIDIQLRSIAYQEKVESTVFQSMIAERKQIAEKIRSFGRGKVAEIDGQLNLALKKIESEAYRKSQEIKGEAEGESIKIYANSLGNAPDFYRFTKNLEVYKKTLSKNSKFILSTDNRFLEVLKKGI